MWVDTAIVVSTHNKSFLKLHKKNIRSELQRGVEMLSNIFVIFFLIIELTLVLGTIASDTFGYVLKL